MACRALFTVEPWSRLQSFRVTLLFGLDLDQGRSSLHVRIRAARGLREHGFDAAHFHRDRRGWISAADRRRRLLDAHMNACRAFDTPPRSRDANASGSCIGCCPRERRGRGECRVKASPMARLQQVTQAAGTTGSAGSSGIPRAMVLTLIRALLGDRAFLPPSPA